MYVGKRVLYTAKLPGDTMEPIYPMVLFVLGSSDLFYDESVGCYLGYSDVRSTLLGREGCLSFCSGFGCVSVRIRFNLCSGGYQFDTAGGGAWFLHFSGVHVLCRMW